MRQMRLLIGPAGSGKTTRALDDLRAALRRNQGGTRLLAPTATLAIHLQNQLAREGLVLRRNAIQTLHGFVEAWCAGLTEVSDPVLALVAAEALRRVNRPEFAGVAAGALAHPENSIGSAQRNKGFMPDCRPEQLREPLRQSTRSRAPA